ncbi:hypothetical protein D9619_011029 [Psilocybe cf. subviscida]|uniref:Uncharacterized protein n=1 Tax=Psilocybe cf. subviscida TaxID=2480587 RepID=A0A8H5F024_9AGAR|nr:hypothetical protein D9619_011029 [Psilocybe cf. subviscida]
MPSLSPPTRIPQAYVTVDNGQLAARDMLRHSIAATITTLRRVSLIYMSFPPHRRREDGDLRALFDESARDQVEVENRLK